MQNLREAIAGYRGRLMQENGEEKRNALLQARAPRTCALPALSPPAHPETSPGALPDSPHGDGPRRRLRASVLVRSRRMLENSPPRAHTASTPRHSARPRAPCLFAFAAVSGARA